MSFPNGVTLEQLRARAEECEGEGRDIRDPDIRMPYRDMAAQWRRMTQQYEESPQARPRKRCPWRGHLFSLAPARSAIGTKRRIDVMQLIGLQDLLYFLRDPWPWGKPHEAAGIHRTSRQ